MKSDPERIAARKGNLLVVNDEAHHTHDEGNKWNDEGNKWNEVIQNLHQQTPITAQLDFFATPRFQKGVIFPWTISDYPLKQVILDGIVKRPMKSIAKIPEAKSDFAYVRYQGYLTAAVERWKEYRNQLKALNKKPVLFIMMNSTEEADDVAEWIAKAYPAEYASKNLREC